MVKAYQTPHRHQPLYTNPRRCNTSKDDPLNDTMYSASDCLKELANKRSKRSPQSTNLPDDMTGFLGMLGADLPSIQDQRTRKMVMMNIENLVFQAMFSEPPSTPVPHVPLRPSSTPNTTYVLSTQSSQQQPSHQGHATHFSLLFPTPLTKQSIAELTALNNSCLNGPLASKV